MSVGVGVNRGGCVTMSHFPEELRFGWSVRRRTEIELDSRVLKRKEEVQEKL